MCVPSKRRGTVPLTINRALSMPPYQRPAGYTEPKAPPPTSPSSSGAATATESLAGFMAVAFGFGLASIFTPCVFPMIPITMSYFLNRQSGGRRDSIVQAVVFCLGIIILFSGLGLVVSAILGPVGVSQLGANVWVNLFITALFVAF